MVVGMRTAAIKGARGAAQLAVKGKSIAGGMRAATMKGARGAAWIAVEG